MHTETHSGVLVEALQDLPSPVPVLDVVGVSVHVEEALHRLRAQEVVPISRLQHIITISGPKQHPKVHRSAKRPFHSIH